jgi:hypothetical protein
VPPQASEASPAQGGPCGWPNGSGHGEIPGLGRRGGDVELPERYRQYFDLILANPDIFSGFFHIDLAGNVLPKLALLRQFGFYPTPEAPPPDPESCGAHSPRIEPQELATRTERE